MVQGKTESGFEWKIEDWVFDDVEVLELYAEIEEGNGQYIGKLLQKVFGKESKKKLYDHVRAEHGNVPYQALMNEVVEIFNASEEGKN